MWEVGKREQADKVPPHVRDPAKTPRVSDVSKREWDSQKVGNCALCASTSRLHCVLIPQLGVFGALQRLWSEAVGATRNRLTVWKQHSAGPD